MMCLNTRGMVDSLDPDQTPRSVASEMGRLILLRPVSPITEENMVGLKRPTSRYPYLDISELP